VILAKPHFSYKFHATVKKMRGEKFTRGEKLIHGEGEKFTGMWSGEKLREKKEKT